VLPEVARLMRASRWLAATDLLRQVERYAPASPELIRLKDLVPRGTVTSETEPAGADVYIRDYTSPDDQATWQHLGLSPVKTDRLPQSNYPRGYYLIRAVKSGFETVAGMWRFAIQDNGIGIAPEYKDHVFGIFKRLHAQGGKYSGTGIGLAICQRIVERNGGRIWVESEAGNGATFYFTVPASQGIR
jgi:signal transduction histidine kinase